MTELRFLDRQGNEIPRAGWTVVYADSEEVGAEDGGADRAFDGREETFWHTRWDGPKEAHPHHLVVDLGMEWELSGLRYLPRQDQKNGRVGHYRVYARKESFPGL